MRLSLVLALPALLAFLAVAGAGLARAQDASGGAASDEGAFAAHVNGERGGRTLPPLAMAADLVEVARGHALEMADRGSVFHNPALAQQVHGWEVVGENVGVGFSVDQVHDAFMASTVHRDEILYRDYTQVGVGVVVSADGRVWVTEVFRQPLPASAPASIEHMPAPAAPATTTPPAPPTTLVPVPAPTTTTADVPATATVPMTVARAVVTIDGQPVVAVSTPVTRRVVPAAAATAVLVLVAGAQVVVRRQRFA